MKVSADSSLQRVGERVDEFGSVRMHTATRACISWVNNRSGPARHPRTLERAPPH